MADDLPRTVLRAVRVTDRLVEELARGIVSGRLAAESSLPSESDLATRYGISKVGVRAAIGVLDTLGLVRVQQGKKTVVTAESDWSVLSPVVQSALRAEFGAAHVLDQLYETRLILEPACARLAAERATPEGVSELQTLLAQLQAAVRGTGGAASFLETDLAIHDTIGRLVRNPPLRVMARDLLRYMLDNWADSKVIPDDLPGLVDEHARIVNAIATRDGDGASAAMVDHIVSARRVEVDRRVATDGPARRREQAQPPNPPAAQAPVDGKAEGLV